MPLEEAMKGAIVSIVGGGLTPHHVAQMWMKGAGAVNVCGRGLEVHPSRGICCGVGSETA